MKYLSILHCSAHNFHGIAVEDEEGTGHRVTPSKCCGSWTTVKRWPVDDRMLNDIYAQLGPAHEAPYGRTVAG